MPATPKRSRKHQFQSGNQKRTDGQPDLLLLLLLVVVVVVMEMVLTNRLTFLTTCMTENLETTARNQD